MPDPGRLIGAGRDALVYDVGGGRVLRRYRIAKDTAGEARMMVWARAHGVRVPEVFDADGADLVMERVDGRAALDGLARAPWRLVKVGRQLADMHHQLDAVPVADWMPQRSEAQRPGVVHCDLHPDNLLLTADGPVLIDWTRSGAGDRRMDLAQTWMIIAELGIPEDRLGRAAHAAVRRVLLGAFLRGVDRDGARQWLGEVAGQRLTDKNMTPAERGRLARYTRAAP